MSELSLLRPTVGIEHIGHLETGRPSLPAKSEAKIVGTQITQHLVGLYRQDSSDTVVRELARPHIADPSLLLPNNFEAAFLNTMDKVDADLSAKSENGDGDHPALSLMRDLAETREQLLHNSRAVNLV